MNPLFDLSQIAQKLLTLEESCFPSYPWNLSQLESHLKNQKTLIIENDHHTLCAILYTENDWESELLRIAVLPPYQGRGLGKAVLRKYLEITGNKPSFLEVSSLQNTAFLLYQNFGYKILDKRKNYYSDSSDAILMKRDLPLGEAKETLYGCNSSRPMVQKTLGHYYHIDRGIGYLL